MGNLQEYFNDRNHSIFWNVGLNPASCTKQLTGVGKPLCRGSFRACDIFRLAGVVGIEALEGLCVEPVTGYD